MPGPDTEAPGKPAPTPAETTETCRGCNGAGSIVVSLCCGRGCATCPGDGMMQAVECHGCRGRGVVPAR